jgi:hypothetical protein
MLLTYHKLRPFDPNNYMKDPHSMSITAHALYSFDPGLCVKTDISIFLYAKTLINYRDPNSQYHQDLIDRALNLKDIGCFGLT